MKATGIFTLEKVTVDGTGALAILGTVGGASRLARLIRPRYEVGVRPRGGEATQWHPVQVTVSQAGGLSIRATVPAAAQGSAGYADVFFRRAGEPAAEAQRIRFATEGVDWMAYPTKFGNFSFKRGSA